MQKKEKEKNNNNSLGFKTLWVYCAKMGILFFGVSL
jgi:hypothetical protein